MGSFVEEVPYKNIGVGSPWTEITGMIDYSRAYADEMRQELADAIDALKEGVEKYIPNWQEINTNIPALVVPDFPVAPNIDSNINDNWPEYDIPDPTIEDINVDLSYTLPVKPNSIEASFDYVPGQYSSCLLEELCNKIKNELINGSTGLNDIVYALIIDRNIEARRNIEDQARQRAYDTVGARGFDLPGGMASAVILELEKEIIAKDLDAVNSTTIKDFELADANARFIKELSLKLEQQQRTSFDTEEDRLFNIAKTSKELVVAIYNQNVKLYVAEWQGIETQLSAAKKEIDAQISINENEVKIFQSKAEVLKIRTETIAAENNAKIALTNAQVSVYDSEVKAISIQTSALIEEVKTHLEEFKINVNRIVSQEQINLQAVTSESDLTTKVTTALSDIAMQSVTAALGMLNTGMSYDYNGATSLRYSTGLTNSMNESHSYEEE